MTGGWAWHPGPDEFIPGVMVFDAPDDPNRRTSTPHLGMEVLSTDQTADTIRTFHDYAATDVTWIIDPGGPVIVEYRLGDGGTHPEAALHVAGTEAKLDVGPAPLHLDPASLVA